MDRSARQPGRRLLAIGAFIGLVAVLIFTFADYGLTLAGASAAATFLGLAAIFPLVAGLKRWGWPSQEEVQETLRSARASRATADATEAMVTDLAEDPAAAGTAAEALRSAARLRAEADKLEHRARQWRYPAGQQADAAPQDPAANLAGLAADTQRLPPAAAVRAIRQTIGSQAAALSRAARPVRRRRLLTGPRALLSSALLATVAIVIIVTSAATTPRQNVTVSCHGSRPVPDVLHLSQDAATERLLQDCFVPASSYMGTTSGYVSFQNPKAGTRQPARAPVYLLLVPKASLPSR
jgi:hypothetical protein